jgi:hypothetical protein
MRTSKRRFLTMRLNRPAIAGPKSSRGFVLIALLAMLAIGGTVLLSSATSRRSFLRSQRPSSKTGDCHGAGARSAYRLRDSVSVTKQLKHRETSGVVYGYLPMPDLGTSRNNNAGCIEEGCEAAKLRGQCAANVTGHRPTFPWRSLGTGPLRDSQRRMPLVRSFPAATSGYSAPTPHETGGHPEPSRCGGRQRNRGDDQRHCLGP